MSISNELWFGKPEGYAIDYSARFWNENNAYLYKTFGTPTDASNWTFSCWIKRSILGTEQYFFHATTGAFYIRWNTDDKIRFRAYPTWDIETTAVYTDVAAWYHLVATFGNGAVNLYVNNRSVGSATVSDSPYNFFTAVDHAIGSAVEGSEFSNHYMAEVVGIDGTAYNPSYFAETNAFGVWVPKDVSGLTFGNNGFWLDFKDSSAFGNDVSGNDNDWASNGLSGEGGTGDQMTDTPTNNYCTLNFHDREPGPVMGNGNLRWTQNTAEGDTARGTILIQSGKWYWEGTVLAVSQYPTLWKRIGVVDPAHVNLTGGSGHSRTTEGWAFVSTGKKDHNNSAADYGNDDWGAVDDVVGVAFDFDTGTLWFSVNDTWQAGATQAEIEAGTTTNAAFTGISAPLSGGFVPAIDCDTFLTETNTLEVNFGQRPFVGTQPAGFLTLSTNNLPDPTIKDPTSHFQVSLYTGNATADRAITQSGNSQFGPDLVWIKNRDTTDDWRVLDSTRGATKEVSLDSNDIETTDSNGLTAFSGSDGFTLGTGAGGYNDNTEDFVAYQWEEGATQGFDIVQYTGDGGSSQTISHGLGVAPHLMVVKDLGRNSGGAVGHYLYHHAQTNDGSVDSEDYYMSMHDNAGRYDNVNAWNDTAPTSSQFTVGNWVDMNEDSETYLAWLWAEVDGFSKFSTYVGNGGENGTFVWTGFAPEMVIVKSTGSGESWYTYSRQRNLNVYTGNPLTGDRGPVHYLDLTQAESTSSASLQLVSNGFRPVSTNSAINANGTAYIYIAFAETPFKFATAR